MESFKKGSILRIKRKARVFRENDSKELIL